MTFTNDIHSTRHYLVDCEHRIVGALNGKPDDPSWDDDCRGGHGQLVRLKSKLGKACLKHVRGTFSSLSAGISFGGGQKVRPCFHFLLSYLTRIQRPGELRHSKSENEVIDELTSSPFWIRVAGFQSCEFGRRPL
jgi:hypothetical protein